VLCVIIFSMARNIKKTQRRTLNLKQFLKCVGFVVLAFYLCVTFLDQQRRINDNVQQTAAVWAQIEEVNLQNAVLEETLEQIDTDEFIKRVARESLRLAMPGDRIFIDSARIR